MISIYEPGDPVQVVTKIALSESDIRYLWEFKVTKNSVISAGIRVSPAIVRSVYRVILDFTRRNDWKWNPGRQTFEHHAFPSIEHIADKTLVSRHSVMRATRCLELLGAIRIERTRLAPKITRNSYFVQVAAADIERAKNPNRRELDRVQRRADRFTPTIENRSFSEPTPLDSARRKLANRGQFIPSESVSIHSPPMEKVRECWRGRGWNRDKGKRESVHAMRAAALMLIESKTAKMFAENDAIVLCAMVKYAAANIRAIHIRPGWIIKQCKRAAVGLSYGASENEKRWNATNIERKNSPGRIGLLN